MQGRRLYPAAEDYPRYFEAQMQPGDYAQFWGKLWLLKTPNGDLGVISQGPHKIVEHADGTITVTPSVQCQTGKRWHGYLTAGVWKQYP